MKLGIYSRGIHSIPNLEQFLPEYEQIILNPNPARINAVAGWGRKPTAAKARKIAAENGLPYISLEDGFIRSFGLGVDGAAPMSIITDDLGVYYDASKESRLEKLIEQGASAADAKRARALMGKLHLEKISKYNCYSEDWSAPAGDCVLVVDQCYDDASVKYGNADAESFSAMLEAAKAENPNAQIIIKTHPDVVAGKRKGYLNFTENTDDNVTILSENINPYILFKNVSKVYTVTSLLGFEALLAGVALRCFGMPFYAGWGLSNDEQECARRGKNAKLEDLVAAVYFYYARYVNPYSAQKCEVEEIVEIICDLKNYYAAHQENYHLVGFSIWKRAFLKDFLESPYNKLKYHWNFSSAARAANSDGAAVVIWAAKEDKYKEDLAQAKRLYRLEDGFIRSRGLGSDLIPPGSLILDRSGIHFNYKLGSDIEKILNARNISKVEILRAQKLRQLILENSITKYNSESARDLPELPKNQTKILVVGQVEGDASIRFGSPKIHTNQALLDAVRAKNPKAYVIYKPHPDVLAGNREGRCDTKLADYVAANITIHALLEKVDEVHTITSTVGFEALLHGKKVVTYGVPFYAGWGLTVDMEKATQRKHGDIGLDEIVAAALIKYPIYYDYQAKLP